MATASLDQFSTTTLDTASVTDRSAIARNLLIAKLLFFCGSMGTVGWTRFQSIFYLNAGLNAAQIGTLKSLGLVLKIVGEPFWCIVADLTDQKAVFSLCILMQVGTMEILRWVNLNFEAITLVKVLRTTTAPSGTFTTTASFALTKGSKEGYGQQRMFGSLAWGGGALVVGCLIDLYGMNSIFWYTYFFHIASFLLVVFGVPAVLFRKDLKEKDSPRESSSDLMSSAIINKPDCVADDAPNGQKTVSSSWDEYYSTFLKYLAEFRRFIRYLPCRVVLVNALMYGLAMNVVDNYLYLSLENDFHSTRTFNGLCTTISTLSCLPIFWYSDKLIRKLGHHKVLTIAQRVLIGRVCVYAILVPSWHLSVYCIAVVQLVHGINFALFWAASVDAVKRLAPADISTSSMATLNIVYFTLAGAIANILWGFVYDIYGIFFVYIGAAILLVLNIAYFTTFEARLSDALADGNTKL